MAQRPCTKGFPLEKVLLIYSKCRRTMYLNYFAELKLLIEWLGEIDKGELISYPRLPWYVGNYELQELAKHLGTSQEHVYHTLERIGHEHRT